MNWDQREQLPDDQAHSNCAVSKSEGIRKDLSSDCKSTMVYVVGVILMIELDVILDSECRVNLLSGAIC